MSDEHARQLEKVHAARAKFESQQDAVHDARRDYYTSVARLHEAGMPLRDIADALGLSHQRVHQMIAEAAAPAPKTAAARAAKLGGTAVLVFLLGAGLYTFVWAGDGSDRPSSQVRVAATDLTPETEDEPKAETRNLEVIVHGQGVSLDVRCEPPDRCMLISDKRFRMFVHDRGIDLDDGGPLGPQVRSSIVRVWKELQSDSKS